MSSKRYPENSAIETARRVVNREHSVAEVAAGLDQRPDAGITGRLKQAARHRFSFWITPRFPMDSRSSRGFSGAN